MNPIQKPEMILIDFDGVISKSSILFNIKYFHRFINQYTPFPLKALICFLKSTLCFSMQHTISFFLSSIGLEDKILECYQTIESYDNIPVKIEDDFYQFLDFCDRNLIHYLIYSSRDQSVKKFTEITNRIGNNRTYDLNGRSKANYNTFSETAKELAIDLNKCMYIDDMPLALRTGKLHGITTVMMLNDIFTLEDYQIFSNFIDYKINSFTELLSLFQN